MAIDLAGAWTDCPDCGTSGSVAPFQVVPECVFNAGFESERLLYPAHLRSACMHCHAEQIQEME